MARKYLLSKSDAVIFLFAMNGKNGDERIRRLSDAGCTECTIRRYLACGDDIDACIDVLTGQRDALLDAVHRKERQISTLDYLVHELRKEKQHGEN